MQEVQRQLGGKTITKQMLYNAKRRIKKESSKWYAQLRESQHDYIFEFKERVNEIMDLQRRHYAILDSKVPTTIKQASLAALHKLNLTLSNYFGMLPSIITNNNFNNNPHQSQHSNNSIPMQGFEIEQDDISPAGRGRINANVDEMALLSLDITNAPAAMQSGVLKPQDKIGVLIQNACTEREAVNFNHTTKIIRG